jgi:putative NADPH-quinone reductase
MRVLVVFAHPVETSFQAALHRTVVASLEKAGHEVDDCDLYAEAFNPVLSREERLHYHDIPANRVNVEPYVQRLLASSIPSGISACRRSSRASSTVSSCPASRSRWSTAR